MTNGFRKAERNQAKVKIALVGPSGSGKTMGSLYLATGIGEKIALIDSERKSASLYAGLFDFDVMELQSFEPETYAKGIEEAVKGGFDTLIIDSISHEWQYILEFVDNLKSVSKNKISPWAQATPRHNLLIEAILQAPIHVIVTMRAKTEWSLDKDDSGRSTPRKVGMGARQRDGIEFEFTTIFNISENHLATVDKDRTNLFPNFISKLTPEIGKKIRDWLEGGIEAKSQMPLTDKTKTAVLKSLENLGLTEEIARTRMGTITNKTSMLYWTEDDGVKVLDYIAKAKPKDKPKEPPKENGKANQSAVAS